LGIVKLSRTSLAFAGLGDEAGLADARFCADAAGVFATFFATLFATAPTAGAEALAVLSGAPDLRVGLTFLDAAVALCPVLARVDREADLTAILDAFIETVYTVYIVPSIARRRHAGTPAARIVPTAAQSTPSRGARMNDPAVKAPLLNS